jgi:hypothetical protein
MSPTLADILGQIQGILWFALTMAHNISLCGTETPLHAQYHIDYTHV